MNKEKQISLILRIGLAFAFLYPAVAAFLEPVAWIGYFPQFVKDIIPNDALLLNLFGLTEVVIALWLLWGKYIFYPSIVAALMLVGIVLFNWAVLDVVFRDLSIAAMAIALAIIHRTQQLTQSSN